MKKDRPEVLKESTEVEGAHSRRSRTPASPERKLQREMLAELDSKKVIDTSPIPLRTDGSFWEVWKRSILFPPIPGLALTF